VCIRTVARRGKRGKTLAICMPNINAGVRHEQLQSIKAKFTTCSCTEVPRGDRLQVINSFVNVRGTNPQSTPEFLKSSNL